MPMANQRDSLSRFTEIGGKGIHYRTGRDGIIAGRPSLVFIHGAGGNARIWTRLRLHFQKRFNILLIDLPGHGSTPFAEGPSETLRSYADCIQSLTAETISGPFVIIGHSLGGAITLRIALDAPGGLSGIVLVCTAAVHPMAGTIADWLRDNHAKAVQKICRDFLYRRGTRADLVKLSIADLSRGVEEILLNDMVIASCCDLRSELPSIEIPAFVVAAEQDRLCPPEHSHYLAEQIPGAKIEIIEDVAHMVMIERPDKLIAAIEPFLSDLFSGMLSE